MNPFHRLSGLLLCLGVWLSAVPADAAKTQVTFILVNDIYQMSATPMPDGTKRGGFARLAAVVKAERASGKHVIVAHGGDTLSPSLMSGIDQGAHIVALTNLIRPDIFAPGNHEFDFGKAVFFRRMSEATFPIYAANLRGPDGVPLPNIRERTILTRDDVRIGLTGAAYDGTPNASSPEDLTFLPTVATARQQAAALRREGADFVVAVVHAERAQTLALMAERSIDLVLSGHNHDLYINYDGRSAVVESSHDAHYVTAIDVTIDVREQDGRRVTHWWPRFRVIDTAQVIPDREVAAAVATFESELARELDVPIATTIVALDSRTASVRTREAAIGNVIADAMRVLGKADAAVMNGGGIRAGKLYDPGTKITRRDILAELPFGNRLVVLDISGRDLRQGLENGLSQWPDARGRFPQVSGIKLTAEMARPAGSRIVSLEIAGAEYHPDRLYRLATNDFLARGSDGYGAFRSAKPVMPLDDAPLLANEVMVYLRRLGTVRTGVEGRITLQ